MFSRLFPQKIKPMLNIYSTIRTRRSEVKQNGQVDVWQEIWRQSGHCHSFDSGHRLLHCRASWLGRCLCRCLFSQTGLSSWVTRNFLFFIHIFGFLRFYSSGVFNSSQTWFLFLLLRFIVIDLKILSFMLFWFGGNEFLSQLRVKLVSGLVWWII